MRNPICTVIAIILVAGIVHAAPESRSGRVMGRAKHVDGASVVWLPTKAKVGDLFVVYRKDERLGTVMVADFEGGKPVVVPWQMASTSQSLRVGDTVVPSGSLSLQESHGSATSAPRDPAPKEPQRASVSERAPEALKAQKEPSANVRVLDYQAYVADTGYIRTDVSLANTGDADSESFWVCIAWVDWYDKIICCDTRPVTGIRAGRQGIVTLFAGVRGVNNIRSLSRDKVMVDLSEGNIIYHRELTAKVYLSRVRPPW